MKAKIRKRKYGMWLHNHTDRDDDDWIYVYATDENNANKIAIEDRLFDQNRFSVGHTYPVKEFKRLFGV